MKRHHMSHTDTTKPAARALVRYSGLVFTVCLSMALLHALLIPLLRRSLSEWLAYQSQGLYSLSIEELRIDWQQGNLIFQGVHLRTDSSLWLERQTHVSTQPFVRLSLPELRIEQIEWWKYIKSRQLHIHRLAFEGGDLYWWQQGSRTPGERRFNYERLVRSLLQSAQLLSPALHISNIEVNDLRLDLNIAYEQQLQSHTCQSLHSQIEDVRIEERYAYSSERPLFARYAIFQLHDYQIQTDEQAFHLASVFLDTQTPNLYIDGVRAHWTAGSLQAAGITLQGIDWEQLLFWRSLYLQQLTIDAPHLSGQHTAQSLSSRKQKHSLYKQQQLLAATSRQWLDSIQVERILIRHASLDYGTLYGQGIEIIGEDFSIATPQNPFFCKNLSVKIQYAEWQGGQLQDAELSTKRQSFHCSALQQNSMGIHAAAISLRHIDWKEYWQHEHLNIGYLTIGKLRIKPPPEAINQLGSSKHTQLLQQNIRIRKTHIRHTSVHWKEKNQSIEIDKASLTLRDIVLPNKLTLPLWRYVGQQSDQIHAQGVLIVQDSLHIGFRHMRYHSGDSTHLWLEGIQLHTPNFWAILPSLLLAGIEHDSLWQKQLIWLDTLRLPHLQVYYNLQPIDTNHAAAPKTILGRGIAQNLASWQQRVGWRFFIQHLHIQNGYFQLLSALRQTGWHGEVRHFELQADEIVLNDSSQIFSTPLLCREAQLKAYQAYFQAADSIWFGFDSLYVNKMPGSARCFSPQLHHGAHRIRSLQWQLEHLQWDSVWQVGSLRAGKLTLTRPSWQAQLHEQWAVPKAPANGLALIYLDTVLLSNASLDARVGTNHIRIQQLSVIGGPLHSQQDFQHESLQFLRATAALYSHTSQQDTLMFKRLQWDLYEGIRLRDVEYRRSELQLYIPFFYASKLAFNVQDSTFYLLRPFVQNPSMRYVHDDWKHAIQQENTRIWPRLRIDSLQLSQARLWVLHHSLQGTQQHLWQGIDAFLPSLQTEKQQLKLGMGFVLSIQKYNWQGIEPLYYISAKQIRLQSQYPQLPAASIERLQIFPGVNIEQEWKQRLYSKTIIQADLNHISVETIPWQAIWQGGDSLRLPLVAVESWQLQATDDLRLMKNPLRRPPMPNQLLYMLPKYWLIDTLWLKNGLVGYAQKRWDSPTQGQLWFHDMQLRLHHVGNWPDPPPLRLEMSSRFMNEGLLNLNLQMLRDTSIFDCRYSGTLGSMPATYLNEMLTPAAKVRLKTGTIRRITFSGSIQNYESKGEMLAVYRNFKVEVLNPEATRRRRLLSKLVNMLIRNTNRSRKGNIQYTRQPSDGFLRILWQSVASGISDTILPEVLRQR